MSNTQQKKAAASKSVGEAIARAAATGNTAVLAPLLQRKPFDLDTVYTVTGSTPLTLAAAAGHVGAVKTLLEHGAGPDVVCPTRSDKTALVCAAVQGHLEVVSILLAYRADPDSRRRPGISFQQSPSRQSSCFCASFIRDGASSAADKDTAYNTTPLMCAAGCGHDEVVSLLLANGASLEARNKLHRTAFHAACMNGHPVTVEALIRAGCNTESEDTNKLTGRQLLKQRVGQHIPYPASFVQALRVIDRQIVGCPLTSAWQRLAWANAYRHRAPPIANTVYQNLPEDVWLMIAEVLVPSVPRKTVAARAMIQSKFQFRNNSHGVLLGTFSSLK